MNKKWLFFFAACLIGLGSGMLFMPKRQMVVGQDTYIVATNAEFAPFSFVEEGQIVGFDIDVAKEVLHRLGKKMYIKDMPFDALIPELTLGHAHLAAAGMSFTEERAKRVLFTTSYLAEDPLVILTLHKIEGLEDLLGQTIVVNEGYTADLFISSKPEYAAVRLATSTDGFLAVKNGRADAFITAKSTVRVFLAKQPTQEFYLKEIAGTEQTCALVVSKKYPELLLQIQKALDSMTEDGTLAAIKGKWGIL